MREEEEDSVCKEDQCARQFHAAVKSRKTAPVFRFYWNPFLMKVVRAATWSQVLRPFRKPAWSGLSKPSTVGKMRWSARRSIVTHTQQWDWAVVSCQTSPNFQTRGHHYKLVKERSNARVRSSFFTERVINIWNSLPSDTVNFSSLGDVVCSLSTLTSFFGIAW